MGPTQPRILVAEDDLASLELLQVFLESSGYMVGIASDGNRAIELGCNGQFDLVILDLDMPVYRGIEVLRMLRKRHLLRPMKVIALTGNTLPTIRDEVEREGIDGFLVKPVRLSQLRAEIERLLRMPQDHRYARSSAG
jgi:CheY-like chemotaxis protein